jgi:hypothetical protein
LGLTKLSLAHNKLTALPDMSALTLLSELRVNDNALTSLPPAAQMPANLRLLDVGSNRIATLGAVADALGGLDKLRNLNLRGNPFVPPEPPVGGSSSARAAAAHAVAAYTSRVRALRPVLFVLDGAKTKKPEGAEGDGDCEEKAAGAAAGAAPSTERREHRGDEAEDTKAGQKRKREPSATTEKSSKSKHDCDQSEDRPKPRKHDKPAALPPPSSDKDEAEEDEEEEEAEDEIIAMRRRRDSERAQLKESASAGAAAPEKLRKAARIAEEEQSAEARPSKAARRKHDSAEAKHSSARRPEGHGAAKLGKPEKHIRRSNGDGVTVARDVGFASLSRPAADEEEAGTRSDDDALDRTRRGSAAPAPAPAARRTADRDSSGMGSLLGAPSAATVANNINDFFAANISIVADGKKKKTAASADVVDRIVQSTVAVEHGWD